MHSIDFVNHDCTGVPKESKYATKVDQIVAANRVDGLVKQVDSVVKSQAAAEQKLGTTLAKAVKDAEDKVDSGT